MRKRLEERFPYLGLYASATHSHGIDLNGFVGDGIDDLLDIVGDLQEVVWRHHQI